MSWNGLLDNKKMKNQHFSFDHRFPVAKRLWSDSQTFSCLPHSSWRPVPKRINDDKILKNSVPEDVHSSFDSVDQSSSSEMTDLAPNLSVWHAEETDLQIVPNVQSVESSNEWNHYVDMFFSEDSSSSHEESFGDDPSLSKSVWCWQNDWNDLHENVDGSLLSYDSVWWDSDSLDDSSHPVSLWKKIVRLSFLLLFTVLFFFILWVAFWLKRNVYSWLPDVSQIKDLQFPQTTVIKDRSWNILYKFFEENREYVSFDKINPSLVNAVVAIEDQRFWEHDGLDFFGVLRALVQKKGGASTIPQQLMTNLFNLKDEISNADFWTFEYYSERLKYKLRQMVLSKRLNTVLLEQIWEEQQNLSQDEIKKLMKQKILELYLNYIELWNHSYWVEIASQNYFKVSASDLSVLQSSVLASLPKGPTLYNPFTVEGKKKLMGYFDVLNSSWENILLSWAFKQFVEDAFSQKIEKADFNFYKQNNLLSDCLITIGTFYLEFEGYSYSVSYQYGRKDSVLLRMYEDWYLQEDILKQSIIEGFSLQFYESVSVIKNPHYSFWIRDLLEAKYGKEVSTNGWIVTTSLDPVIQQKAEEVLKNNQSELKRQGANNSSLLYLNTDNGDVLAYVGSLNYDDQSIQWQVDMVRSPRQSWSSIKPLLYALWFLKLPLTIDTPIFDLAFSVSGKYPHNADGWYEGLLPLRLALWHSRNIPSVKMFLAVGGESVVKPFFQSLWLKSVLDDIAYWYSLSLGAAEVPMLELASAYSHLTTVTPATIDPILQITTYDGTVIYQKQIVEQEEKIPSGVKYLLWNILSDPKNRLAWWISKFNISWLTYALKTWTSNVVKNWISRPRDGRMVAYVPNRLVLMWAWNTNASPMYSTAYGGEIHANPIKQFMWWLLSQWYLKNSSMPNVDTTRVKISKITWRLAAKNAPSSLIVSTLWYSQNLPKQRDKNVQKVSYDPTCLWKAWT